MKKLFKLCLSAVITGSFLLSYNSVFANTEEKIVKVQIGSNIANINGNNITIDAVPYIQEKTNSTMIPLRFVANTLDVDESNIKFDATTKIVTITKGNDIVEFKVNSGKYKKNGATIATNSSVEPIVEIKNGRTFVPFRTLAEAFNLEIEWESSTKTAIMKNGQTTSNSNEISATDSAKSIFNLYILGDKTDAVSKLGISEEECNEILDEYKNSFVTGFISDFKEEKKAGELFDAFIEAFRKLNYTVEETVSTDGKTKTVIFNTNYIDINALQENVANKFSVEVYQKGIDESKFYDTLMNIYINELKNYKSNGKVNTFKTEFSIQKLLVNGEIKNVWMPSSPEEFGMKIAFAVMGKQ